MKKIKLYQNIRPSGFSLIEIMIVILLIALISVGGVVLLMNRLEDGQISSARNQAYNIAKALDLYRLKYGRYPTQSEGLEVLVNPPKGKPFLKEMPQDPWQNDYIYIYPGEKNRGQPDVKSMGPDGEEDTEDDIGNWSDK